MLQVTEPTPEQIQAWKDVHGTLWVLKFEAKEETLPNPNYDPEQDPENKEPEKIVTFSHPACRAILKPLSRSVLAQAQQAGKFGGELRFNETVINNCWLGGDPIIKTKDAYFLGAGAHISQMIEVYECELEKI